MLIKSADDRSTDIIQLNALLDDASLTASQRKRILGQRDNLEKGEWGEQQAAYFIDFHFAASKNNAVLHDLRLVLPDGRTAQIDHVIINRMMFIYVLESKNWKQLTVDKTGTCTIWSGRIVGVESPLEQCHRHATVLSSLFNENLTLKSLAPKHEIIAKVLVAPSCNLRAPHHTNSYVKADHFRVLWEKEFDDSSFLKDLRGIYRRVSTETLEKLARALASLHKPNQIDWRTRFGVATPSIEAEYPPNRVVLSIEGLSDYVPKWGEDWFVLNAEPTDATKKIIKAAGYRAKYENGEWIWRLKS